MKTNYLMLTDLLKIYHPETRGVVSASEVDTITTTLCLDEMNILQLRNLVSNILQHTARMVMITISTKMATTKALMKKK